MPNIDRDAVLAAIDATKQELTDIMNTHGPLRDRVRQENGLGGIQRAVGKLVALGDQIAQLDPHDTVDGMQMHRNRHGEPVMVITMVGWHSIHRFAHNLMRAQVEFYDIGRRAFRAEWRDIGSEQWRKIWKIFHGEASEPIDFTLDPDKGSPDPFCSKCERPAQFDERLGDVHIIRGRKVQKYDGHVADLTRWRDGHSRYGDA